MWQHGLRFHNGYHFRRLVRGRIWTFLFKRFFTRRGLETWPRDVRDLSNMGNPSSSPTGLVHSPLTPLTPGQASGSGTPTALVQLF